MTRRVYIACLASYNCGVLHGEWVDLDGLDADDVRGEIARILRASPRPNTTIPCPDCGEGANATPECTTCGSKGQIPSAEEWAATDYEGFGSLSLGEHPNLDELVNHVDMIGDHGDAWIAFCNHVGEHYATPDGFQDSYHGHHDSAACFAQELCSDSGIELGSLANYIDWEGYARDMGFDGWYFADDSSGGVYVFSP